MNVVLWILQLALAVVLAVAGAAKVSQPHVAAFLTRSPS